MNCRNSRIIFNLGPIHSPQTRIIIVKELLRKFLSSDSANVHDFVERHFNFVSLNVLVVVGKVECNTFHFTIYNVRGVQLLASDILEKYSYFVLYQMGSIIYI